MSEQGKSRKPLIVGIAAAVVILAALLGVLLSQCSGGVTPPVTTDPGNTSAPTEAVDVSDGRLYWNLDRAEYDGKSEGGMSSRPIGPDGYYHIRFFVDGQVVELLAEDRRIVNSVEVNDLMGLEVENGVIKSVIPIEQMSGVKKVGWKFYVQSVGGSLIKVNSSDKFNGMEVILDTKDGAKVYDMTDFSGEPGTETQAVTNDRVVAVSDKDGKLLAVYIYDRSNMVIRENGYCEHCDKDVEWTLWDKDNSLPNVEGHYKLNKDIQLKSQLSMKESVVLCLDLNGKTVTGAEGKRVISMHNMNTELAIMDTSEEKNGRLVAHGQSEAQGLCVWVRYGAFYLYDGILDASQAVTTNVGGTAVYVAADRFFYMNGGEIIGGVAMHKQNASGKYINATGGAVYVKGGKFVMNDGVIRDGKAQSVSHWVDGKLKYERGNGGNIYVSSGVFEMNGGVIKNGRAGTGGNIFLDGTTEFTMNGGQILNGSLTDPGRNGGNIYINSKVKAVISGGTVSGGTGYSVSGNIHLAGTLTVNGGTISGGRIMDIKTGKDVTTKSSRNMYVGNGATFYMSGGWIYGGVAAIDSDEKDGKRTLVYVSGVATIADGPEGSPNLTLLQGKQPVKMMVGPMLTFSRIGVNASGIFSEETSGENLSHFFSDVKGADVLYTENRLAIGKMACLCGSETQTHMGECTGEQLLWGPWTDSKSLPRLEGNYYLTGDVNLTSQAGIGTENGGEKVNLNLNGFSVTSAQRAMLVYCELNLVDHVGGGQVIGAGPKTNNDHTGTVLVYKGGKVSLYAGTLKLADKHYNLGNGGVLSVAEGAEFVMYGGCIDGRSAETEHTVDMGGAVRLHGTMTVLDGTIYGGNADRGGTVYIEKKGNLTVAGGTVYGGTTKREGGNIYITGADAVLTLKGEGVLADGSATEGGNIRMLGNTTVNLEGGIVRGGTTTSTGGNISVASGNLNVSGDAQILDGSSGGIGGNIYLTGANATLNLKGGLVSGGKVNGKTDNHAANIGIRDAKAFVSGGTVKGGFLVLNGTADNLASITVSGKPVITCEETYGLRLYALNTGAVPPVIQIPEKLEEGASIHISNLGVISGETLKENASFFHPTDNTVGVVYLNKCIAVGRAACLCGAAVSEDSTAEHKNWCDKNIRLWQAWDGKTDIIEAGSYYLTDDATSGRINVLGVSGEDMVIDLDLNGKTLTATGERAMNVVSTVNLVDHGENGTITGKGKTGNHSAVAVVSNGGVLNFYDGTLKLAEGHAALGKGGTMAVAAGGKLVMYADAVVDATASLSSENSVTFGAAIRVSGEVIIEDGTIKGGKASDKGGAIYIEGGSVTMKAGSILGGTATEGGNIAVTGETAAFVMNGGKLSSGYATSAGGAIRQLDSATVQIGKAAIEGAVADETGGSIATASGTLTLNGAAVTGGKAKKGGNIHISGGVLNLSGATVTLGEASVEGGNIYATGCTLTMEKSTVSGGVAASYGGNLYVAGAATANVKGSSFSGGSAKEGGSIRLQGSADLTIQDTTVSGGVANTFGGNIHARSGNVYLRNATIENGEAGSTGGNMEINGGVLHLESGTVTGGKVKGSTDNHSANICVRNSEAYVSGGTVTGSFLVMNTTTENKALISITGSPVITCPQTNGLKLVANGGGMPLITLPEALGTNASIAIYNTSCYISGKTVAENAGKFLPLSGNGVEWDSTECLYVGKAMCLCGASKTGAQHKDFCDLEGNRTLIWRPWDGMTAPASGNYYLTGTVTGAPVHVLNTSTTVVNLDLNGHSYSATKRAFQLSNASTLRIVDNSTSKNGVMTGMGEANNNGGVISNGGSSVYLCGGTFKLADHHQKLKEGGVIAVGSKAGRLHIYNDVVVGSTTGTETVALGGAIRLQDGKVYIHGGTVIGNSHTTGDGSTIYVRSGEVHVIGGKVRNGDIYVADGTLSVDGQVQIEKVTLAEGKKVTLGANLNPQSPIGIEMVTPGVFAENAAQNNSGIFTASNAGYEVFWSEKNSNLSLIATHTHDGNTWKPIEQWTSHRTSIASGGYHYLNWTGSSAQSIEINTTEPVYLCLNGAKIYAGMAITLCEGANLTICDCKGTGCISTYGSSYDAPIWLNEDCTVNILGGTIDRGNQSVPAVHLSHDGAELYITNCTLKGDINVDAGSLVVGTGVTMDGEIWQNGGSITDRGNGVSIGSFYSLGGTVLLDEATSVERMSVEYTSQVTLSGPVTIEQVILVDGDLTIADAVTINLLNFQAVNTISITGNGINADVVVAMGNPGPIADVDDTLRQPYAGFKSAHADLTVGLQNGQLVLGEKSDHQHCFCVNAEAIPEGHVCDTLRSWTAIEKGDDTSALSSGSYFLNWTGSFSNQALKVDAGQTVYLCMNGSEIRAQTLVRLGEGSVLHICDHTEGAKGAFVPTSTTNPTVLLDGNKTVYLYSGTISGKGTSIARTAVQISNANAKFFMYGGTITGGSATNGGNVEMSNGTFYMYGGTISDGVATGNGGNIALTGGTATFTMHNGKITGGKAGSGGNVAMTGGTKPRFIMNGGEISDGEATATSAYGGNICLTGANAEFELNKGLITGGYSNKFGGNVAMRKGKFTMNDGTITSGETVSKGGNLMIHPNSAKPTFTMNGGKILGGLQAGETNAENGGNICINGSSATSFATFTMTGGEISGGQVSKDGANVYVYNANDKLTLVDGAVSEDTIYYAFNP